MKDVEESNNNNSIFSFMERYIWSSFFCEMFQGQSPESYPEIRTVERVNKWVYSGIEPTQPSQIRHD